MDGRGGIGVEGGGRVGPHACTRISLYLSDLIFPLLESLCEADSCIQILCTHALDLLSPGGDSSLLVPDLHKIAIHANSQRSRHSQTAAPLLLLRADIKCLPTPLFAIFLPARRVSFACWTPRLLLTVCTVRNYLLGLAIERRIYRCLARAQVILPVRCSGSG